MEIILFLTSLWFTTVPPEAPYKASSEYKHEVACLAATMYKEANAEGVRGMLATGHTTLNRARDWKRSICSIVRQKKQYSWLTHAKMPMPKVSKHILDLAEDMIYDEYSGTRRDFTNGSMFFAHKNVKNKWTTTYKVTYKYKNHVFYKEK